MNLTSTKSRSFINKCCGKLGDSDVQRGIGAVLVLVGFTLLVSGVIFTAVAHTNPRKGSTATFPYIGPVLIFIALSCMMVGLVLNRFKDIKQIREYLKYRQKHAYVYNEELEREHRNIGAFNICCFRLLSCVYNNRNRANAHAQTDEVTNNQQTPSDMDVTERNRPNVSRTPRQPSFTSLRQFKVHPSLSETSVV